jgi:hypothetical protein
MFFVGDKPQNREKRIREFLLSDPAIAVLLAAAHFEWTASRAILFLSATPNTSLRKKLRRCTGLERYKDLWRDEVSATRRSPCLASVVKDWSIFRRSFELRHELIHGRGTCTRNFASPRVDHILQAASDIHQFSADAGADLNSRMPIRRERPKRPNKATLRTTGELGS